MQREGVEVAFSEADRVKSKKIKRGEDKADQGKGVAGEVDQGQIGEVS